MNIVLHYLPLVISIASVASALLPAPKPGSVGWSLVAIINLLAANVGHAGNATPSALKTESNNTSLMQTLLLVMVMVLSVPLLLALTSPAAQAASIQFTCTGPATRADGSVLAPADIGGYKFYRSATTPSAVASSLQQTCAYLFPVPVGQCVETDEIWAATVIDKDGLESSLSNQVTIPARTCTPKPRPGPPINLKAVVVP